MLELDSVVKHYQDGEEVVRAVDGVSLTVGPGETVAVYGPSGSGKTTLLLLIAALLRPDAGLIRFLGQEISALTERQASVHLLRHVGLVYQSFHLMPRVSAVENAARKLLLQGVGMREAKLRAVRWLQAVGLADRLDRPPERLSAGERQRVAIARALAAEPSLILADEPTGNLDTTRSREIVTLLRDVARERQACGLIVTHDPEVATIVGRRYVLRDGRLLDAEHEPQPALTPAPAAEAETPDLA